MKEDFKNCKYPIYTKSKWINIKDLSTNEVIKKYRKFSNYFPEDYGERLKNFEWFLFTYDPIKVRKTLTLFQGIKEIPDFIDHAEEFVFEDYGVYESYETLRVITFHIYPNGCSIQDFQKKLNDWVERNNLKFDVDVEDDDWYSNETFLVTILERPKSENVPIITLQHLGEEYFAF